MERLTFHLEIADPTRACHNYIFNLPAKYRKSIYALKQEWATYGPQAAYGPREHFVRPASTFESSVNLSDDDKRGNNCRIKEPKTLHATMKKAFVNLHRRIFRPFRG